MNLNFFRNKSGFTVIEILSVLAVLGILAAVAVSRMSHQDDMEIRIQTQNLKAHLRYAKLKALNSGSPDNPVIWGIESDGSHYWLFKREDGVEESPYRLPGEENDTVPEDALGLSPFVIGFDYYGRPLSDPSDPDGSLWTENGQIETGPGVSLTVIKNTGLIR